jgi:hypothetical protein
MKEDEDKYYLVIYQSETIVFDRTGKKIVACPTEDEAIEYIRKLVQSKKGESENG